MMTDQNNFDYLLSLIRNDATDNTLLLNGLISMLKDALPPGYLEINYKRGFMKKFSKKSGEVDSLKIFTDNNEYIAGKNPRGLPSFVVSKVVNSVVISRREIDAENWLSLLFEDLKELAKKNEASRDALIKVIEGRN
jgi:hypothetical protein